MRIISIPSTRSISLPAARHHAGLVGKFYIEKLARTVVEVDVASEFRYREPIVDENACFIAVSQSGETSDTLATMKGQTP